MGHRLGTIRPWQLGVGIVALCLACVLLLNPSAARAGSAANGPRWGVRIALAGTFSGLTAADGSLYSGRGRTSQLVQIDPLTKKIEAIGPTGFSAYSVAFAGGAIWATGVPTADPASPFELVKLNATTLRREKVVNLGSQYKPLVFNGPGGQLWSATGWSQLGPCIIRRLSTSSGTALIAQRLRVPDVPAGGCSATSFTPNGAFLFVMTGSTNNLVLYKLAVLSLKVVVRRTLPDFAESASVVASNTRVWLAGGYPGANGDLVFLDASSLRILAESPDLSTLGSKISADLPEFSQWPDVTLSGGRVWIASDGTYACFLPSSRKTLAMYIEYHHRPIATGQITEFGGVLWAIGQNASATQQQDLVIVSPPRACAA